MPKPARKQDLIAGIIRLALKEDIRTGDITTRATIPPKARGRARIMAKEPGIMAGLDTAVQVFKTVDRSLRIKRLKKDGDRVRDQQTVLEVTGSIASILTAERTALNFLQRLSGIATATGRYARELKGLKTKVIDTRKTTPGMRYLEKAAVRSGGGGNHRTGLWDMFLIKDNHTDEAGGIAAALTRAQSWKKRNGSRARIEIETRTLEEVRQALPFKPDWIMLDNMPPAAMKKAVGLIRKGSPKTRIEASGNITLRTIRRTAKTGVDFISVGALTHSVPALDLSLLAVTV